ncbi:hypothetical protein ACFFJY_00745 [Fictibacillus aquaticus]|uniref:Uncharacterized protein n=1 Tax=Fictibacillus aquaticus TaxID=2021314 RepID=A0A235F883_9BACL|nr:hypothetical protein [Fictibacillus aquaticus]OYD57253.1 hypothetical protein CGZ90_11225 [Fictibacillus aquaticus]
MIKKWLTKENRPHRLSELISMSILFFLLQLYILKKDIPGGWIGFIGYIFTAIIILIVLEFIMAVLLKGRDREVKNSSFVYSFVAIVFIIIAIDTIS